MGGTANWDASTTTNWAASSGGAGGQSVPTSSDNVFFDLHGNEPTDAAYTVTITATANCLNLDIAFTGTTKVTIAGSSALNIAGNLNMSGGTGQITRTYTGAITFTSTTTGKTVTMNGITLASSINFNGVGGGWTLQDGFTTTSSITLTAGTLDTNNVAVSSSFISTTSTSTKVLTLGSTTWTLTTGTGVSIGGTNLTLNANTSLFTTTVATFTFDGGGKTFNNFTWAASGNGSISINSANSFNNLSLTGGAVKTAVITLGANQTITGTLTINGSGVTNRLLVNSTVVGTTRTLTAAIVSITNTDFMDITGAGAASSFTGTSLGDCGGNSGITFTTPATQHWLNASSGTWSTAANWTSRVPLPQDDVVMDKAFGTSQTVTADMPRLGKSIDWTGATWTTGLTWAMSTATSIFGSLTMISNLTMSGTSIYTFQGRGSYTITGNGLTFERNIILNAPSGTLTLGGDLTLGVTRTLTVTTGTLSAVNGGNNYVISTGLFVGTSTGTITLGSATHLVTGSAAGAAIWTTNGITISASSGTIKFVDTSNTDVIFSGGGTYNNIWFSRGASTGLNAIQQNNTFADIKDDGSAAHTLRFQAGTTQTVSTFTVSGNGAGNEITITSTTTGTHTLTAPSRSNASPISCDYLNIQHSIATQANTWYAGANSIDHQADVTAGSGWIFTVPVLLGGSYDGGMVGFF